MSDIAVGDLDGDLVPEIITGTDSSIFCVSCSGTIVWNSSVYGGFGSSNPLLVDVDRDGTLNLIFFSTSFQKYYCIDMSTFSLLWTRSSGYPYKVAICDVNFDGTFELISNYGNVIAIYYRLNEPATNIVEYYYARDQASFSLYDLDSDGALELIFTGNHRDLKMPSLEISCWSLNCPSWSVPGPTACRGGSLLGNNDFTDTDRDGLTNALERCIGTNPFTVDTDSDMLDDYAEIINGTNPIFSDFIFLNAHKAPVYSGLVNFSWNYTGDIAMVDNFNLHISNSSSFDTTLLSIPGIMPAPGTTSTNASLHFPTGCYFWRVAALKGNETCEWSVPASFSFILNDFTPRLENSSVNPSSGNQSTPFIFTATFMDADNNPPQEVSLVLNGTVLAMEQQDPGDLDYVDGCTYTLTMNVLPAGTYVYHFRCNDGQFSNQTGDAVLVVLHANLAPWVQDVSCTPSTGTGNETLFSFDAWYWDMDNDLPVTINVTINGTACPMVPLVASDTCVVDGKLYRYETMLPCGTCWYQVDCFDGQFFNSTPVMAGPVVLPPNHAPTIENESVSPVSGCEGTSFTFTAIYRDLDNDAPLFMLLVLGTSNHSMIKQDPLDADYTDGCTYACVLDALPAGNHAYWFMGSDGMHSCQCTGGVLAICPVVLPPNHAPTIENESVSPVSGCEGTSFTFMATYRDLDNDAPLFMLLVLGTSNHSMIKQDPLDDDYTDGCAYACIIYLEVAGDYDYHVVCGDGSFIYTSPPGVLVVLENVVTWEPVCLVSPGNGSVLGSSTVEFSWNHPASCTLNVSYTWQVAPDAGFSSIVEQVDGIAPTLAIPGSLLAGNLTWVLDAGTWWWRVRAVRDGVPLDWTGGWSFTVQAIPQEHPPLLVNGSVTPVPGDGWTSFTFAITYVDADGDAPAHVHIVLDGTSHLMAKRDASDVTYADGCVYEWTTPGSLSPGMHEYVITCSDGIHEASTPAFYFLEVPGERGAGSLAPAVVTLSFSIPVVLGIAWTVVARRRASRTVNVGPGTASDTLRRFSETIAVRSHARVPAYGVEFKSITAERGYE